MADGFHGGLALTRVVHKTRVLGRQEEQAPQETHVSDVRQTQARVLWDNGWGRARFPSFESYLATIPSLPRPPADPRFSRAVLVDSSMRLADACRVLGLEFGGDECVFNFPPSRGPDAEVYWIWVVASASNVGQTPFHVMQACWTTERGVTALEGVALFAQYPHVLSHGRMLCLAGSRLCSFPAYCACLLMAEGQPTLGVAEYCVGSPDRETLLRWW